MVSFQGISGFIPSFPAEHQQEEKSRHKSAVSRGKSETFGRHLVARVVFCLFAQAWTCASAATMPGALGSQIAKSLGGSDGIPLHGISFKSMLHFQVFDPWTRIKHIFLAGSGLESRLNQHDFSWKQRWPGFLSPILLKRHAASWNQAPLLPSRVTSLARPQAGRMLKLETAQIPNLRHRIPLLADVVTPS